jgi:DNA primase large subunit
MEPLRLARYPFLHEASDYVRSHGVNLEELLTHPAYSQARRRGKDRVLDAINEAKISNKAIGSGEEEVLLEVLSYPVARMLVSCLADEFLIRRYALSEAKAMSQRLETEDIEVLKAVAVDLGVSAIYDDDVLSMHFCDFLRYTSGLRGKEWKLVNQEVRGGFIPLTKNKFSRVLEQALQDKIEGELPLPVSDAIFNAVVEELAEIEVKAEEMRQRMRSNDFGEISITSFPPCMKRLIAMAGKGENMPHAGRFAIVTFLSTLGMPNEEIIKTFQTSPDFDNSMTTYQVRHITGDGMGRRYTPPECSTMRTNGICVDQDSICLSGKIRHPLSYYRVRSRHPRKAAEGNEEEDESMAKGQDRPKTAERAPKKRVKNGQKKGLT